MDWSGLGGVANQYTHQPISLLKKTFLLYHMKKKRERKIMGTQIL